MDKRISTFLISTLIAVSLQLVLFIPFYFKWRKDCKEIGKKNLSVSLKERFLYWLMFFPFWVIPIVIYLKGE